MASCDAFVTIYVTLFCTWVSFTGGMHMPPPLCIMAALGFSFGIAVTSSRLRWALQAAGSAHRLCHGDPT